ncbi:MAG: hypothetical protein VB078_08945 [Clostridiaceae bacterium]|nr:hypothetical protein [Clostridiaceae bacterium]
MKKNIFKKAGSLAIAAALVFTGNMLPVNSLADSEVVENKETIEDKINGMISVNSSAADKEETVYIISGADGTAKQTIISEWLKNKKQDQALSDYTELQDIENTNGYETFSRSGNMILWNAGGKDIHYRGTTNKELPVTTHITYYLDGVETAPENMAGKSGHVTIRFDYTNNTKTSALINGQQTDIYVPFLMTSGLILDGASFSNVTVSTGTVYNDGSRNIIIGCALPGLAESLQLDQSKYKIPEYVEIEADTTDFSLSMTLTVAMNSLLNNININSESGLSELSSDLSALESASKQLADGASALSDGASALSSGLGNISSNSASLTSGAYTVFESLTKAATEQLSSALTAQGYDAVSLTPSNYSKVLTTLLDSISSGAYSQATAAAEQQVRAKVNEQVQAQVTEQVTAKVKAQVTEQVSSEIAKMLTSKGSTQEQAAAYLLTDEGKTLVDNSTSLQMASDNIKNTIAASVEAQMISDEVKQKIEAGVMQGMNSAAVKSQVESAVSSGLTQSAAYQSIVSLKAQLDGYQAFYSGLKAYTIGVDSAYKGSVKIADGSEDLKNGAQQFYSEGIEKLVSAFNGDYQSLFERLKAVADAGKAYQSFGGISDGMAGNVRFIWKTEGISE